MKPLKLKVSEALSKDVTHAYARMGPEDLARLQVEVGGIVEVTGKGRTVCKAMPAYKELRGQSRVQLDGITRENAGTGLDEFVQVSKIGCPPAERVVLAPVNITPSERDLDFIGSRLDGLPILADNRLRVSLFGTRWADFKVESTSPPGPVLINPTTQLVISKAAQTEEAAAREIAYEDIGGLKPQLLRIREMIELPLRYPEVFERLGIDAPKGVLLHGPPGCGKTLIARAIAHETQANFYAVSGPEIIHKFYGESEAHLRKIFEEGSRKAPSIIFLDEIDAIAPRREQVVGEVEKRVVAQLLALMDGLAKRRKVIVIAATNLPNVLDPALRRPGRFDREIGIPIPDRNGRREILEIHSRGMPLAEKVDVNHLAEITHGFVGADLEALCREAAMICLRRIMPDVDFGLARIPYDQLGKLEVNMEDFLDALRDI
jgi:transitional endoplasmic reticulum ATPase